MGLMYAWATKEYLLWEMTIGQIFLYRNKAIDIKNGKVESSPGLTGKTLKELQEMKDNFRKQYGDIGNG